jgi:four helix bundle protein
MIAKRYEELEAWQLADELKREVYALTETGAAAKDFKYRDQIRDSAASNRKNISEGFGRFRPAPFAQFMEFAVGSAMETKDALQDGVDRGYFTPTRVAPALKLAERSIKCSTKLIVYLKSCKKKEGSKRGRQPSGSRRRTSNENRNDEPRTTNPNDERRTTNQNDEPRTANQNEEPRTANQNEEPRTTNDEPS